MSAAIDYSNEPEITLRVGQVLDGRYRVDYLIGQGGMAAVWAGTNERTGKHVALKVLLPSLMTTPGVDALFQREGVAASRVNHPNVVTVFDVIEHQGTACIVMELLTGESLDSYLARNVALTVNEVCGLLLPAMLGVSAAHGQGVIHRDLKPQNIFVCVGPDGRAVTTKVLDFGISIIVELAREPVVAQTPNVMMGTPAYMAPEQISGSAPIDERTDVYGFGVLFYESLTGQVPFPGEPGPALYERVLHDPAPPPTGLRPDLRPGLVHIIETALAKQPAHRFASLNLMIAALESELVSAGTPASGVPLLVAGAPLGSMADAASGSLRMPVQPGARKQPSGEHLATQFLVNFPLQTEGARRTGNKDAYPETLRTPGGLPAWKMVAVRLVSRLLLGAQGLFRSHRMQSGARVGLALLVVAGAFTWRRLGSNNSHGQEVLPLLLVQAGASNPSPPSKPIVEQIAPTPVADGDANSAPSLAVGVGTVASKSMLVRKARVDGGVLLRTSGQRAALSPRRAKARASAGSVSLRAGSLSVADF